MTVMANPPHIPVQYLCVFLRLKEKARRTNHWTMVPTVKAMATEMNIPAMIIIELSILMKSPSVCVASFPLVTM